MLRISALTVDEVVLCTIKNDSLFFNMSLSDGTIVDDISGRAGQICDHSSTTPTTTPKNKPRREISVEVGVGAVVTVFVWINTGNLFAEMKKLVTSEVPALQEHITIYNRRHLAEKYNVSLQLGKLSSGAPLKRSSHFATLESLIINFMQLFAEVWHSIVAHSTTAPLLTDRTDEELLGTAAGHGDADNELAGLLEYIASSDVSSSSSPGGSEVLDARLPLKLMHSQLFFQFYYITDELVYFAHQYGTDTDSASQSREQRVLLKLATLQYSFVFRHRVFQRFLIMENRIAAPSPVFMEWFKQFNYFMSFIPMQTPATEVLYETKRVVDRAVSRK